MICVPFKRCVAPLSLLISAILLCKLINIYQAAAPAPCNQNLMEYSRLRETHKSKRRRSMAAKAFLN